MTKYKSLLPERDGKDLGWHTIGERTQAHYFRSIPTSSMMISHCTLVILRRDAVESGDATHCLLCKMVEQMRIDSDHRKQNGGSVDK